MDGIPVLSGPNLALAQTTVATLATVLMIGVGFLARPSRASLLWSLTFVLTMVSTCGVLLAHAFDSEDLRRAAMGIGMGATGLIWSGFRARRRAPTFWWLGGALSLVAAVGFVAAGDTALFSAVFRVLYLCAGAFAALTIVEWYRSPARSDTILYPLIVVSTLMVVVGVLNGVGGFIFPSTGGDDLGLMRLVNQLGLLIYIVCALVSLIGFSTRSARGERGTVAGWAFFVATAEDRLTRARMGGERSWSLLHFFLDDFDDLRDASGATMLSTIVDRFEASVRAEFPADADIGRTRTGTIVVLVSRPRPGLREIIRSALASVARQNAGSLSVHLSASVGWATAADHGYDLDRLIAASASAAAEAQSLGGDRWQRVPG